MIRNGVSRRTIALAAICVAVVVVGGWLLMHSTQSPVPSSPSSTLQSPDVAGGVSTCALATLPPEVAETVRVIHSNGPFPFPRNDGVVFGNREGHLPGQAKGYYREYTVITPGARQPVDAAHRHRWSTGDRSARSTSTPPTTTTPSVW